MDQPVSDRQCHQPSIPLIRRTNPNQAAYGQGGLQGNEAERHVYSAGGVFLSEFSRGRLLSMLIRKCRKVATNSTSFIGRI